MCYNLRLSKIGIRINPFYLYSIVFTFVIILYNLKWSYFYPDISIPSYIFFIFTITISFILGFHFNKYLKVESRETKNPLNIKRITIIIILLNIVEFIYVGNIPFIEIAIKNSGYSYKSYTGIPTFHVILVTFNLFFASYVFNRSIVERSKKYFILFCINIIPFILMYSRGLIVFIILNCISIYIVEKFNGMISMKIILLLPLILIGLYYFGISGNIRSQDDYKIEDVKDSSYIMMIGNATSEFRQSKIPKPYYWAYIYSTCSLANFQKTVNHYYTQKLDIDSMVKFVTRSLSPDFISERINDMLQIKNMDTYKLITPPLTTAICYTTAYVELGWLGAIMYYIYFVIYIYVYRLLLNKDNSFFVTGFAILNTISIFNLFDNGIAYSPLSLQLIYPIILSFLFEKNYMMKVIKKFR